MVNWIYDIETYPNCFTVTIVREDGKFLSSFEISDRKDESERLKTCFDFLIKTKATLVGFNNLSFDYPVIHEIIKSFNNCMKVSAKFCYKKAQSVIDKMKEGGFYSGVKTDDCFIRQLDLYKIWHFDNAAKSTSLKKLEIAMRSETVEDLPFEVGRCLSTTEIDSLLEYNKKDVSETLKFFNYSKEAISLRDNLSVKFGFDCSNYNDTKIGKQLLISMLELSNPQCCYKVTNKGLKMNQTKREEIKLGECIFKYINFDKNRKEFLAVLDWVKSRTITETKGVFSNMLEHEIGGVAKYAEMVVKKIRIYDPSNKKNNRYVPNEEVIEHFRKTYPCGWLESVPNKSPKGTSKYYWKYRVAENLNVVVDGFRYDFGVGGIHGAKKGTHESTPARILRTLDVASYYPNMSIANDLYPEHLGVGFCKVYKSLYEERKKYPKKDPANLALKLALNGTYGDSNNEFSPLYDPKFTMSITIGGQLSLCMLIGALIDHCNAEIVMCNTDGFEYFCDTNMIEKADSIVKRWENLTGLTMESGTYSKMFIRDVNNYIAVTVDGEVKTKGAYEVQPFEKLGWHKDHSMMIVPIAVREYLVNGVDYKKTIVEHTDKFDFCLSVKLPRAYRLMTVDEFGNHNRIQNTTRYYPVTKGGVGLIKEMPPVEGKTEVRITKIEDGKMFKVCNDMRHFTFDDIDYSYFFEKCKELIDAVA